jgi:hypothetical protein
LIITDDGLTLLHLAINCDDRSLAQYLVECTKFTMVEMECKCSFFNCSCYKEHSDSLERSHMWKTLDSCSHTDVG